MNPLLTRHLYGSARKNRFFVLLTLYLLGISILTLLFIAVILSDWITGSERISMQDVFMGGRALYWFSSALLLLSAIFLAPINALGALSSEREQHTLDLLRVTTLPARALVLGKLGAACLNGGLYLLAPLPLLLLGYWIGGVTTVELVLTFVFLIVTLLHTTAWGLFVSSLTRKTIAAILIYYGFTLTAAPLAGLFVSLVQAFFYNISTFAPQPFWIEVLMQYGWVFLTALHPLAAAIATEALWIDQGSWFLATFTVQRYIEERNTTVTMGTVTLPSPWIPYTCLCLLITALLIWQTSRRLAKPDA